MVSWIDSRPRAFNNFPWTLCLLITRSTNLDLVFYLINVAFEFSLAKSSTLPLPPLKKKENLFDSVLVKCFFFDVMDIAANAGWPTYYTLKSPDKPRLMHQYNCWFSRFVLSCGKDSTIKLWEVGSGRLVKQYLGAIHTQLRCQVHWYTFTIWYSFDLVKSYTDKPTFWC